MTEQDITLYLEPIDFRPNGICNPPDGILRKVETEIKEEVNIYPPLEIFLPAGFERVVIKVPYLSITIPIVKVGAEIDICDVTMLIKKTNKGEFDCMGCVSACEEEDQIVSDFPTIPPLITNECMSDCLEQIRWYQGSHKVNEGYSSEKTIADDIIYSEVKIPKVCGLIGLSLTFEVTGNHTYLDLRGNGCIPEDNSLKRTYDNLEGIWRTWYPFGDYAMSFYPGEQITAYAHFSSAGNCNPMPIAYGYFETRCFTSGIIKGCGLVKDGKVIEGGEHYSLNNNWIGDDRLKWYVLFKGNYFWLECSDFAKYAENDRVIIWKNGIGRTKKGLTDNKCRNNDSLNKPAENEEVLTDNAVSYVLNSDNDVIIPIEVYG